MEFPKSMNVRVGAKDYSRHDMSKTHITTQDFGFIKPIECKICFPGDKIRVNVSQLTRLLTMPAPTYGKVDMVLRAFFVPVNTVWKGFNDFISNNKVPTSSSSLGAPTAPFVYLGDIAHLFTIPNAGDGANFVDYGTETDYDITTYVLGATFDKDDDSARIASRQRYTRKYTYLGRKFYDFLVSLGLKFSFYDVRTSKRKSGSVLYHLGDLTSSELASIASVVDSGDNNEDKIAFNSATRKISVLPLVCFWKFYLDWVVPSRFLGNYSKIRYVLDRLFSNSGSVAYDDLLLLFTQLPYSFLEDDYFTTLFKSPYGYEDDKAFGMILPNSGATSDAKITASSVPSSSYPSGAVVGIEGDNAQYLNLFSLKSLGALQDMVNRGKIAGTKAKDYLFTTYGIRPSDDALHISTYLGSTRIPITFDSIESKSDTYNEDSGSGALLGQQAGVGNVGNSSFKFSYDCKGEHGFLFITSELQTKTSYTQGLAPEFDLLDRFDFFDPSLDALGVEAVPASMLCNSWDTLDNNLALMSPNQIFGYSPRYSKYKVNFDNISGDFLIKSLNTGLDSWHLARIFKPADFANFPMINEEFCRAIGDTTSGSYDRIFSVDNNSIDHFYSIFHIDMKMERKMKSLKDSLEFEDGGKTVEVSINGSVQS